METSPRKLSFSASTVKSWFQYRCDRKTRYETMSSKQRDTIPILKIDSPALWAELGNKFEKQLVSNLAGTHRVLTPAPGEDTISEALTAAFLRGDRHDFEFAYHSVLRESKPLRQLFDLSPDVGIRWSIPDLIRVTRSSAQPVFQVIDIKATQVATLFHKAQVAFYALVLRGFMAELGAAGSVADEGEIWHLQTNKTQAEEGYLVESFRLRSYEHLVIDFFQNRVPPLLKQEVSSAKDTTFFHIYFKCEQCEYLAHCRKTIAPEIQAAKRDVSAVPGLSHESKRALERMGIKTVGELAKARGLKSGKRPLSWALRARAEQLVARADALVTEKVSRLPERFTYLMPPRVDVGFFISIDVDPVEGNLAELGLLRTQSTGDDYVIEVLPTGTRDEEAAALQKVLGKLLQGLSEIDSHNAAIPEQKIYAHIFLFEPSEATSLQEALARHLDNDAIRTGLLEMIRIFPPEDAIPEPEYRGIHHLPATALRSVLEQLYAIPTTVSYDLRQVTAALAKTDSPLVGPYVPNLQFQREFSSRLSIDVSRMLRTGNMSVAEIRDDVSRRLRATAGVARWLLAENAQAQQPFLRLNKQPFRFQNDFHPLEADDLDVLQAQELLESRAGLLSTLVELALPAEQRRERLRCFADLKLLKWGKESWKYWMLFQVPEESRQAEMSPGELSLILTDDDPNIRLNYQRWNEFAIELPAPRDNHSGATLFVVLMPNVFNGPAFQELLHKNHAWYIDKTYRDFNSPRVLDFLRFLAAKDSAT